MPFDFSPLVQGDFSCLLVKRRMSPTVATHDALLELRFAVSCPFQFIRVVVARAAWVLSRLKGTFNPGSLFTARSFNHETLPVDRCRNPGCPGRRGTGRSHVNMNE